jgi:hypothetical protein
MVTEDFAKFVADQQEQDADSTVDWAQVRDEWLGHLDSLYEKIVDFLREYSDKGTITLDFTEIELTESDIGSYRARKMDIRIGKQRVSLVPVGTLLVGCRGRVDVLGSAGRAQLLLVNEKVKRAADLIKVTATVHTKGHVPAASRPPEEPVSWAWKILTNTAQRALLDLDKESFLALLMEIASA